MKQLNYISIMLLLISSATFGQLQLGRQVIGSTGSYATGTNITVSSTVGETMVQTLFSTNFILTQGFQQTLRVDSIVDFEVINESCIGASNGSIFIDSVKGCPPLFNGNYIVVVTSGTAPFVQVGQTGLTTGDYNVIVNGLNGCQHNFSVFIGLDSDEVCKLKFYTGITPNGDTKNDEWIIENIELFPENTVQIFNRLGKQVWWGKGYDNDEVQWYGNNGKGEELPDGTYFYVVVIPGQSTYRGWVEVTR